MKKRYQQSRTVFDALDPKEAAANLEEAAKSTSLARLRELDAWAYRTACFEVLLVTGRRIKQLEAKR